MNNLDFLSLRMPEDIEKYLAYGDFKSANKLIDIYMGRNITDKLKKRLDYQKEVMKRLEKEYIYNFDEALDIFKENVEDFTRAELEYLKDERYTDWIFVDGKIMFHKRVFENTAKVHPGIRSRLKEPYHELEMESYTKSVVEDIMKNGSARYKIHIKKGLKMKDEFFIPMKKLHVHLPMPKEGDHMSNIEVLGYSLDPKYIASLDEEQRTVYFEEEINYNIAFTAEYSFESEVVYREFDLNKVEYEQPDFYLDEFYPHIRFTPYLVDLAHTIVGTSSNPLQKARKIYDYITQNIQYSFMRNYGTLENIPEFAAYNLKGDCGVQALLFITLCRIVGVPSRWQSGLVTNPHRLGPHDWVEFYVAPYGWLYADLSFGGMALRLGEPEIWDFYFGHVDPFRMLVNTDIQKDFNPPKKFLRNDPYDNQNGEMEYEDRGIYPDEYDVINEIVSIEKI